jgi:hypothetical protein
MPKLQNDFDLEQEADKSGMIHGRKGHSETEFLDGYGTTNFGISNFEEVSNKPTEEIIPSIPVTIAAGAGIATIGLLAFKFKDEISKQVGTLVNYALLLKESTGK